MQGSRRARHRPAHSAHGPLYWWAVMWPVAAVRALERLRADDDTATPRRIPPPPPPPPVVDPWTVRRPWATHEGAVRPLWEERDSQVV
jgi:hypothetical protein